MDGYQALQESAAWMDLSGRGKIRAGGQDRARLLHAMLSNAVEGLEPGQGNYHFLLNNQGRIQADANLYVFSDHLLLDCEPERAGWIYQHLDHYIIADDVALEDTTASLATVALEGPRCDEIGGELAGVAIPAEPNSHLTGEVWIAARSSSTGQPGIWFFVGAERKAEWIARLEAAGAVPVSAQEARVVRVENAVPRYGDDFGDTTLPQETQVERGVSFHKGCYLGQEIVERIRSRGQVHRLLVQIGIEGTEPPPYQAPVLAGEQEVGRLTSPVYSPRRGHCLGLAILRREFAVAGQELVVDGRPARVASTAVR